SDERLGRRELRLVPVRHVATAHHRGAGDTEVLHVRRVASGGEQVSELTRVAGRTRAGQVARGDAVSDARDMRRNTRLCARVAARSEDHQRYRESSTRMEVHLETIPRSIAYAIQSASTEPRATRGGCPHRCQGDEREIMQIPQ